MCLHYEYVFLQQISIGCPAGVWVCSSDMMLAVTRPLQVDWQDHQSGISVFAVSATEEYAKNHGMYRLQKEVMM